MLKQNGQSGLEMFPILMHSNPVMERNRVFLYVSGDTNLPPTQIKKVLRGK